MSDTKLTRHSKEEIRVAAQDVVPLGLAAAAARPAAKRHVVRRTISFGLQPSSPCDSEEERAFRRLHGLHVQAAGCVVDEPRVRYLTACNRVVKRHLAETFVRDWLDKAPQEAAAERHSSERSAPSDGRVR